MMVAGSLLGLDVNGVLEVTFSYPLPAPKTEDMEEGLDEIDTQDYQIEMMKMLRSVNVDNNCVGWYQSMYLGTLRTNEVVSTQYIYQSSEGLSDNCVVVLFDPIQSKRGNLVIKAFRLSDKFVRLRKNKQSQFIKSEEILVELPVKIKNSGHIAGFVRCLEETQKAELENTFESLSLESNSSVGERHLELMNSWCDDLLSEQNRFQQYSKGIAKQRQEQLRWLNQRMQENAERKENGEPELSTSLSEIKSLPEIPPRTDALMMIGQLNLYCKQLNDHVNSAIEKLSVTSKLNN